MTIAAVCPACGNPQMQGLLDDSCTTKLENALREVPALLTELDVSASKQARIGSGGGAGLANERNAVGWGAVQARDVLTNVLATWVLDVRGEDWPFGRATAATLARDLLSHINEIRRHPAVDEMVDEIVDGVNQARRAIDRPAERQYLGTCLFESCTAEVWARVGATETTCRECGITHDVAERRDWLLQQARPMIVTPKEAAVWIGEIGTQTVSEKHIRNWVARGKVPMRPTYSTQRMFELGALLDFLGRRNAEREAVAELPVAV